MNTKIYTLINTYPTLKQVLFDLGFKDITKPRMMQTVGRIMTLKKASTAKDVPLKIIEKALNAADFNLLHD
ncbi:MAG: DUF1858 domain-containing protein [Candidatus Izimaplasma sp.]|nr:DUF1858 domain-containing protein [Candidatus Izimaplasma bacterium]